MSSVPVRRFTAEEYLEFERDSPTKHQFFAGEIFAMSGASEAHTVIAMNVGVALSVALKARDCQVYPSDMRVLCPSGLYTYPDGSVACGPRDILKVRGTETLRNPLLVIEVLSPSTEAYDLGRKFERYRAIPSLRGVLFLAQDRPFARHMARREEGWLSTSAEGIEAAIRLPELDLSLPLADLYAKVEFQPEAELPNVESPNEPLA